jgi:hypothetical protein
MPRADPAALQVAAERVQTKVEVPALRAAADQPTRAATSDVGPTRYFATSCWRSTTRPYVAPARWCTKTTTAWPIVARPSSVRMLRATLRPFVHSRKRPVAAVRRRFLPRVRPWRHAAPRVASVASSMSLDFERIRVDAAPRAIRTRPDGWSPACLHELVSAPRTAW